MDSEYPGYVYLVWSYLLTEDSDVGKYNAVRHNKCHYLTNVSPWPEAEPHGPTMTERGYKSVMSADSVYCVRCLSWP